MTELLIAVDPANPTVVATTQTTAEEKARQLPQPSGYHILCAIPEMEKEFEKLSNTLFSWIIG